MLREIDIAGVCLSPFVLHLLETAVAFLVSRWLLARLGLISRLWHPALCELLLFVSILSAVGYQ
jgi:hypothetical protein